MLKLKKFYLAHEGTGEPVLVGYKVKNLEELEELGYRISRSAEEDFLKTRRRGVVYISRSQYDAAEQEAVLYNSKGSMIAVAYRLKQNLSDTRYIKDRYCIELDGYQVKALQAYLEENWQERSAPDQLPLETQVTLAIYNLIEDKGR